MNHWTRTLCLSLPLALTGLTAQAGDYAPAFSIGAFTGAYMMDDSRNIDDNHLVGFTLGHNFDENWTAEALFSNFDTKTSGGTDMDILHYRLDALYHFDTGSDFTPFLAAGIGATEFDADGGSNDTDGMLALGGGVKYAVTDAVNLRADYRWLNAQDSFDDRIWSVGLNFLFGGADETPAPAPVPAPAPMPVDSDGDGVYDNKDACPDTATNVVVDAKGCPVMIEESVSIDLRIQFDTNKADILSQYDPRISDVAAFMKAHPTSAAIIEGHTDSMGAADYNQALSQRRADSVRQYLIDSKGITASRLKAVGYGETRPVADNANAEGRHQNRRVVAVIKGKMQKVKTK